MGSLIEFNDTLKISVERGFPKDLRLEDHVKDSKSTLKFIGRTFDFTNSGRRIYQAEPSRVFLVQEIDGKWLYWGHARILRQTMTKDSTTGLYQIIKIYDPEYQRLTTMNEAPEGKSYL